MSSSYFFKLIYLLTFILVLCELSNSTKSQENAYMDCSTYKRTHREKICGTDGYTYANKQFLECINQQNNTDVAIKHQGECAENEKDCKENLLYLPICDSNGRTWSNNESFQCHLSLYKTELTIKKLGECEKIDYCNITQGFDRYGFNPVCGSNGFTYENAGQVKCLQKFNYLRKTNLHILRDGYCHSDYIRQLYDKDEACEIAQNRFEWNPVCASNGKTYANPFIFFCKTDLKIIFDGACNSVVHNACNITGISFIDKRNERRKKQVDADGEVCGNNGRNYTNIHHLRCYSHYNKYFAIKHKGHCEGPQDNPCGAVPCEESRYPICASDGMTYVSIEAMWCAARHATKPITYKYDGPC